MRMSNVNKIILLLTVLCMFTVLTQALAAGNEVVFEITPNNIVANVGDTVTVPFEITSLPSDYEDSIVSFTIKVEYDPEILKIVGTSPGSLVNEGDIGSTYSYSNPNEFNHSMGWTRIVYTTIATGFTETGNFYNINFEVLDTPKEKEGTSEIKMSVVEEVGGEPLDIAFNSYEAVFKDGTITVAQANASNKFIYLIPIIIILAFLGFLIYKKRM